MSKFHNSDESYWWGEELWPVVIADFLPVRSQLNQAYVCDCFKQEYQ